MNRKEMIMVGLLALLNFTHILDFMIMMPLGNILMPKWSITSSQFAIVVSAYSLSAFVSSFSAIFFADNYDRKKLLLFSYFGFLIGTLSCVFSLGYYPMIAARILTGIFGGLIAAQVLSIIGDVIPYERRGTAMGLLMGGFALASVLGVPIGLYMANEFDWHAPFIMIVVLGFILFPFLYRYVPNVSAHITTRPTFQQRISIVTSILNGKKERTAILFSALMISGHFVVIPLINPYMVYNAAVPQDSTPLIYLVGGISALITGQLIGKVADKYGKKRVFVIAAAVSTIFVVMITNMPKWPLAIILSIFALWFSTATARTVPAQAMITEAAGTKNRGSFMNLNSCIQSLGTGFATLLSGWITFSDSELIIHNYYLLGVVSIILIAASIVMSYQLDKLIQTPVNTAASSKPIPA